MTRVIWTSEAISRLDEIEAYIDNVKRKIEPVLVEN